VAGGCLSAAVAQRSHDERIPLRAQVLIYPILDDRTALVTITADAAGSCGHRRQPARLGAGDLDLLYEESVRYAEQLKACAVPCELITIPRMCHGGDLIASKAASMQEFRRSYGEHLRTYL
jgi:acetyl esterase/lipase